MLVVVVIAIKQAAPRGTDTTPPRWTARPPVAIPANRRGPRCTAPADTRASAPRTHRTRATPATPPRAAAVLDHRPAHTTPPPSPTPNAPRPKPTAVLPTQPMSLFFSLFLFSLLFSFSPSFSLSIFLIYPPHPLPHLTFVSRSGSEMWKGVGGMEQKYMLVSAGQSPARSEAYRQKLATTPDTSCLGVC